MSDLASSARLGLALSGGGARASFFHIGVLARLAELDILRHVEVISTVSGGSIVGALYYLHVKNLIETVPDTSITRKHYIEIVKAVEEDFLATIKQNIRARIFFNIRQNFHMASPWYSRTDRIGDILDRVLYRPVWRDPLEKRWFATGQIRLRDLLIHPVGESADFEPDKDNGARGMAKVPMLLINATTLNTGRDWRFEAVRMGEPVPHDPDEAAATAELDTTFRLDQGYFQPRPNKTQFTDVKVAEMAVANAVASSAAVPGGLHPVAIVKAYGKVTVQLVDGGVHDNQGLQAVYDHYCTHVIASDASGQIRDEPKPATRIPAVAFRSLDIYGSRVRHEQMIRAQRRPEPFAFVHLRRGVNGPVVPPEEDLPPPPAEGLTSFGVSIEAQRLLSRIRTDLDNFGDVEAASLMLDGYLMIDEELEQGSPIELIGVKRPRPVLNEQGWHFWTVHHLLTSPNPPASFLKRLRVGAGRMVKPLAYIPAWVLIRLVFPALLALAAVLVVLTVTYWDSLSDRDWPAWLVVVSVGGVVLLAASYLAMVKVHPVRIFTELIASVLIPLLLAPVLWLMALSQLTFNSLYLGLAGYRRIGLEPPAPYDPKPATSFSKRPEI